MENIICEHCGTSQENHKKAFVKNGTHGGEQAYLCSSCALKRKVAGYTNRLNWISLTCIDPLYWHTNRVNKEKNHPFFKTRYN